MATHYRRKRHQEEEESVFISMTDMTVSFLFIMLLLLAFFASQIKPDEMVERSLYEQEIFKNIELNKEISNLEIRNQKLSNENARIKNINAILEKEINILKSDNLYLKKENERLKQLVAKESFLANYLNGVSIQKFALMNRIKDAIEQEAGIKVEIDPQNGVIRFRGNLIFGAGKWQVSDGSDADKIAKAIGNSFDELLPCFSLGKHSSFNEDCNSAFAALDTIQIEGHTDDQNLSQTLRNREQMLDNFDLSARRSTEMFRAMTERHIPRLVEYLNLKGQPILSFSGYGDMRPLVANTDEKSREINRRIDLRFIMATPNSVPEIEVIKENLISGQPSLESRVVP